MANTRSGPVRGKPRTKKGTIPWRDDPLILERVNLVRTLRAQGYTAAKMVPLVRGLLEQRGVLDQFKDAFSSLLELVYNDLAHCQELHREETQRAAELEESDRQRHITSLRLVMEEAWKSLRTLDPADPRTHRDRSRYMAVIRQCEETIGKFDRSFVETVEVQGEVRTVQGLLAEMKPGT